MDFDALEANYNHRVSRGAFRDPTIDPKKAAAQTLVKKKKQGGGGPLTAFISEAAGTGVAMGGAALGASLGSIVPGIGTAVGGLAGALIGGFGFGTAGKAAEQKIRDDQNFLGEGGSAKAALTEGAIEGVMGAGPLRLARLAGKGTTTGLAKAAGSPTGRLADALMPSPAELGTAATKATAPLKTSAAGRADDFGNKMLGKSQWGIQSKPSIRSNDPAGTSKQMFDMGLTKNTDIERTGQAITGSDGILNRAVSTTVNSANPLQIDHFAPTVEKTLQKSGLTGTQSKALHNEIMADVGLVDPTNPASALDVMRNLKAAQQQYLGKGGTYHLPTSADIKRAKVIGTVHDEIENTLYKTAGANGNLSKVLTPEFEKELLDLHPGNAQWESHVKNNIMTAKSVGDLRSAQAPFVKAGKLIHEGEGNAHSASGHMVNSANGIRGAIVDATVGLVKEPLQRAAGVTAKKVAPLLPGGTGAAGAAPTSLAGALSTVTAPTKKAIFRNNVLAGAGGALLGGAPAEAQALDMEQPEIDPATGLPVDPTTTQQIPQVDEMGNPVFEDELSGGDAAADNDPFNPANVANNVKQILANGGNMKHVQEYLSVVGTMQELTGGGEAAKLNATTASSLASSSNGLNTLGQLEQLYGQAGGGSGKLGGLLQNLTAKGGLNGNVQTYNDLSASSVSQLAKALNGGGQVSDTDAAVIIQALPKITDSPQVAQAKFNALKQRLAAARQNTLTYNGADPELTAGAL